MSDHLTRELLEEILSRLPVKSILICRCVSKTWYSLISNPSFIAHHHKKTAARNSGLLFFSYSTRELVWPFKENVRYLLYPDESFPANPIEELDCPLKDIKRFVDIVGSFNGVFCLSYGVYGRHTDGAALWNPSVRKIVNIPCPNVTFTSHGFYKHLLGFGFDSATDDYKLVRIVYLPDSNFNFDKIPPLVEIYSLRSRVWRKVDNNDLKYVIADFSTSAFLNGTCHWVATKPPNGPGVCDAIVSFSLGEEVFGEMEVPDCLVKKYQFVDIAVFDGSLLLVASFKLTGEGCFTVWMMKEYGVPGSWTRLFDIPDFKSHLKWIRKLVAFRQSGQVLLAKLFGQLVFYDPKTEEIFDTKIRGNAHSFYLDTFVESLVLLNETDEFTEVEASEDNGTSEILEEVASSSNS
ncbi:F-box/kelch-repeat protein At3g06240-like [Hevea brasiliensis]|uniref:F-box/kelch-repeat protein At3g06240-like n=1 Tax=Hevea brasiliensis TaxID=3981 RepID=UPI0025E7EF0E|nr:F-box/kelch-repeat protein At3g06240-like [Hevea brasiliensis]